MPNYLKLYYKKIRGYFIRVNIFSNLRKLGTLQSHKFSDFKYQNILVGYKFYDFFNNFFGILCNPVALSDMHKCDSRWHLAIQDGNCFQTCKGN